MFPLVIHYQGLQTLEGKLLNNLSIKLDLHLYTNQYLIYIES